MFCTEWSMFYINGFYHPCDAMPLYFNLTKVITYIEIKYMHEPKTKHVLIE